MSEEMSREDRARARGERDGALDRDVAHLADTVKDIKDALVKQSDNMVKQSEHMVAQFEKMELRWQKALDHQSESLTEKVNLAVAGLAAQVKEAQVKNDETSRKTLIIWTSCFAVGIIVTILAQLTSIFKVFPLQVQQAPTALSSPPGQAVPQPAVPITPAPALVVPPAPDVHAPSKGGKK